MKHHHSYALLAAVLALSFTAGCGVATQNQGQVQSPQVTGLAARTVPQVMRVSSTTYDPTTQTASIRVTALDSAILNGVNTPEAGIGTAAGRANFDPSHQRENMLDISDQLGIVNYATSTYPNQVIHWVRVIPVHDASVIHKAPFTVGVPQQVFSPGAPSSTAPGRAPSVDPNNLGTMAGAYGGGYGLPPGAYLDRQVNALAGPGSSRAAKVNAVLRVARSKLGTPYIWGHNEDRGQYGFDCSNFTAYVYHHALGYVISCYSVAQYKSVGIPIPRNQVQPGDLMVFERGKHVGIYVGNEQMIDAGGGKGKVSYMTVAPRSYWGNHLTVVKRMF